MIGYVKAGKQAHVPLPEGWVSEDRSVKSELGDQPATAGGYAAAVRKRFGADADWVIAPYRPTGTGKERVLDAAQALATDAGIGTISGYSGRGAGYVSIISPIRTN